MTAPTPQPPVDKRRSSATPLYVAIGVLSVVLVGLLIWAFLPRDNTPQPEPTVVASTTSPSSTREPAETTPVETPTDDSPSEESAAAPDPSDTAMESAEDKIAKGYDTLRAILPQQLEGWQLQESGGQPVYKDSKRRISFVVLPARPDDSQARGTDTEKVFDGGVCDVNTASSSMISCTLTPEAGNGYSFIMSSRYSDMDEMVRLSRAVIAAGKR